MRKIIITLNAVCAATMTTLVLATLSCLFLIATVKDTGVRKTGLFGAVVFETSEKQGGTTQLSLGVHNPIPLIIISLVLTGFFLLTWFMYQRVLAYKQTLLNRQNIADKQASASTTSNIGMTPDPQQETHKTETHKKDDTGTGSATNTVTDVVSCRCLTEQ